MTVADPAGDRGPRRPDLKARFGRDLDRYSRRETDASSFWRSLALVGSVGWPIVLTTVGGALGGRWLDAQWHSGIRYTLILLVGGAVFGATIAWHLVKPER
jgi:ATP synthase protein I